MKKSHLAVIGAFCVYETGIGGGIL